MTDKSMSFSEVIETIDDPARGIAREARDALLNRMEVKAANAPVLEYNYRIRKQNWALRSEIQRTIHNTFAQQQAYSRRMKKPRKLKAKVKRSTKPVIKRLHDAREKLAGKGAKGLATLSDREGRRTPEEWEQHVASIADPKIRAQVACLVWWDFFATRSRDGGRKYWDNLDRFVDEWVDGVSARDIAKGLMQIGYHPYDAAARSIGGDIRS